MVQRVAGTQHSLTVSLGVSVGRLQRTAGCELRLLLRQYGSVRLEDELASTGDECAGGGEQQRVSEKREVSRPSLRTTEVARVQTTQHTALGGGGGSGRGGWTADGGVVGWCGRATHAAGVDEVGDEVARRAEGGDHRLRDRPRRQRRRVRPQTLQKRGADCARDEEW